MRYLSAQRELGPQIWRACREYHFLTIFREKIFFRPGSWFFRNLENFMKLLNFQNPENFVKLPDFEGKITPQTHSNHHKMNVIAESRFRKWFPTILGMFPGSLTTEKQSWIFGSLEEADIRPLSLTGSVYCKVFHVSIKNWSPNGRHFFAPIQVIVIFPYQFCCLARRRRKISWFYDRKW